MDRFDLRLDSAGRVGRFLANGFGSKWYSNSELQSYKLVFVGMYLKQYRNVYGLRKNDCGIQDRDDVFGLLRIGEPTVYRDKVESGA